jgi:hypothetical protein
VSFKAVDDAMRDAHQRSNARLLPSFCRSLAILSDKIVEAGEDAVLREIKRLAGACVTTECVQPGGCKETCGVAAAWAHHFARAYLSAALAAAEVDGVIFTRVPEAKSASIFWKEPEITRVDGWNACRTAVLAGKVTL